jgi:hypothetical protein
MRLQIRELCLRVNGETDPSNTRLLNNLTNEEFGIDRQKFIAKDIAVCVDLNVLSFPHGLPFDNLDQYNRFFPNALQLSGG